MGRTDKPPELILSPIGAELRKLRLKQRIQLPQMAVLVGRSKPHLSNIENGNFPPTAELLYKYAEILQLGRKQIKELFALAGIVPPPEFLSLKPLATLQGGSVPRKKNTEFFILNVPLTRFQLESDPNSQYWDLCSKLIQNSLEGFVDSAVLPEDAVSPLLSLIMQEVRAELPQADLSGIKGNLTAWLLHYTNQKVFAEMARIEQHQQAQTEPLVTALKQAKTSKTSHEAFIEALRTFIKRQHDPKCVSHILKLAIEEKKDVAEIASATHTTKAFVAEVMFLAAQSVLSYYPVAFDTSMGGN